MTCGMASTVHGDQLVFINTMNHHRQHSCLIRYSRPQLGQKLQCYSSI